MQSSLLTPVLDTGDAMAGMREWRNIQDVVRRTFAAMQEVITEQGRRILALEQAVAAKADRDYVEAALVTHREAGAADARFVREVRQGLERVGREVEGKASAADVRQLRQAVEEATHAHDSSAMLRQQQRAIEDLRELLQLHVRDATCAWPCPLPLTLPAAAHRRGAARPA